MTCPRHNLQNSLQGRTQCQNSDHRLILAWSAWGSVAPPVHCPDYWRRSFLTNLTCWLRRDGGVLGGVRAIATILSVDHQDLLNGDITVDS